MNTKRWLLAALAGFVTYAVAEMLIHGMLLQSTYEATASLWRPKEEMESLMWAMWLSEAIVALVMAFVYSKGYEVGKNGLGQGLRFGFYISLILAAPGSLGSYFAMPIPASLAVYWFIATVVSVTAVGGAIGLVYKR
jgi:hypothetical protein